MAQLEPQVHNVFKVREDLTELQVLPAQKVNKESKEFRIYKVQ
jgi:hypothetical protein